jgi:hypothetical protein
MNGSDKSDAPSVTSTLPFLPINRIAFVKSCVNGYNKLIWKVNQSKAPKRLWFGVLSSRNETAEVAMILQKDSGLNACIVKKELKISSLMRGKISIILLLLEWESTNLMLYCP